MSETLKEPYYSTKEAAKLIGCDKSYLNLLIREGQIEAMKIQSKGKAGYRYMIPEREVERLMALKEAKDSGLNAKIEDRKIMIEKPNETDIRLKEIMDEIKILNSLIADQWSDIREIYAGLTSMNKSLPDISETYKNTMKDVADAYKQGFIEGYRSGFQDGKYAKKKEYNYYNK